MLAPLGVVRLAPDPSAKTLSDLFLPEGRL